MSDGLCPVARTPLIALGWSGARASDSERLRVFFPPHCRCVYHSHFAHNNMAVASLTCPTDLGRYFTVSGAINKRHGKSSEVTSKRQLSGRAVLLLRSCAVEKWTGIIPPAWWLPETLAKLATAIIQYRNSRTIDCYSNNNNNNI